MGVQLFKRSGDILEKYNKNNQLTLSLACSKLEKLTKRKEMNQQTANQSGNKPIAKEQAAEKLDTSSNSEPVEALGSGDGGDKAPEKPAKIARRTRSDSFMFPYIQSPGNVQRCLDGIVRAATPVKFSQRFLEDTLELTGGGAKPLIPFLKKTGFLQNDGTPTSLYHDYRDETKRGLAAAAALRTGFAKLFEYDENIHEKQEEQVKAALISISGVESKDRRIGHTYSCFSTINSVADFTMPEQTNEVSPIVPTDLREQARERQIPTNWGLGYTINLQLPDSNDPEVFVAIFKALREQLLIDD